MFNKNVNYYSNKINLTQFINTFFITNNTFNILLNNFTKITNIKSNNKKNYKN